MRNGLLGSSCYVDAVQEFQLLYPGQHYNQLQNTAMLNPCKSVGVSASEKRQFVRGGGPLRETTCVLLTPGLLQEDSGELLVPVIERFQKVRSIDNFASLQLTSRMSRRVSLLLQ
jgi:hypothetical protein